MTHIPVMCEEAVSFLNVKPSGNYVDATLGSGGHAKMILEKIKSGMLAGIDADAEAIERAKQNLKVYGNRVIFKKGNFSEIDSLLEELRIKKIDGIIFDLGVSSEQLDVAGRGFSFRRDGKLDMQMDREALPGRLTAEKVVNTYPQEELEKIISDYGEEHNYRRIAAAIVRQRSKERITSTISLAGLIGKIVRRKNGIDPATKTFQAIRIEVNGELASLSKSLQKLSKLLKKGGRLVVISYHSLEDRIVKHFLKENRHIFRILTKKPLIPSVEEIKNNPRSRSAKLRAAEII